MANRKCFERAAVLLATTPDMEAPTPVLICAWIALGHYLVSFDPQAGRNRNFLHDRQSSILLDSMGSVPRDSFGIPPFWKRIDASAY